MDSGTPVTDSGTPVTFVLYGVDGHTETFRATFDVPNGVYYAAALLLGEDNFLTIKLNADGITPLRIEPIPDGGV